MSHSALPIRLAFAATLLFSANSCELPQGTGEAVAPTPEPEQVEVFRWWDHPDSIEQNLLAIGSTGIGAHMGMTRNSAMIEGRSKLQVTLEAYAMDLIETWLESTSRCEDLPGLRLAISDPYFIGHIAAPISRTAPVILHQEENGKLYALIALKSPNGFLKQLSSRLKQELIEVETFFPEDELKQTVRQDLDTLIKAEKERIKTSRAAFEAGPIETEPSTDHLRYSSDR